MINIIRRYFSILENSTRIFKAISFMKKHLECYAIMVIEIMNVNHKSPNSIMYILLLIQLVITYMIFT